MEFIRPEEFKNLAEFIKKLERITNSIKTIGCEPRYGREFAGVSIEDGELVLILKEEEWNEFTESMQFGYDFIPLYAPSFSLKSQQDELQAARNKRYREYEKLKKEFEP